MNEFHGTPHNRALRGDIAKTVLMPGDPLRAKLIAENFLENAKLINDVRNTLGYTGNYKGKDISVMASGMGMASIGIYSYELYTQYGVESIIRTGSAGAFVPELSMYDVVLAESAWSESTYARVQNGDLSDIMFPDELLNQKILSAAQNLSIPIQKTKVYSSDVFYGEDNLTRFKTVNRNHQCTCIENECFALFHNAKVLNKKAACILTISENFVTDHSASAVERQNAFTNMIQIALESVL